MVAMEKAGIPSVGIAARSFARAWQACVDGWGQPATAFVTIPHACTGQQPDYIHKMVDEEIDNIILGLTRASLYETFPTPGGPTHRQASGVSHTP